MRKKEEDRYLVCWGIESQNDRRDEQTKDFEERESGGEGECRVEGGGGGGQGAELGEEGGEVYCTSRSEPCWVNVLGII
jgi:hypothetical protein